MCRKIGCTSNRSIERTGDAATLALYILIAQACSDFCNFSPLSYHGNITYNESVRYKLNETSEKTRGR